MIFGKPPINLLSAASSAVPRGFQRVDPDPMSLTIQPSTSCHWCCCIAAAFATAVVVVAGVALVGRCSTMCSVLLSLPLHFPSLFFLSLQDSNWVSSVTRISRAALVAARHTCRRPRAVRRCGPLFIRTHHDFCHHVKCLFDTWFLSCIEFAPSPFSSPLPSRVVLSVRGVSWSEVATVPKRKSHRGLDLNLSWISEEDIWKVWKKSNGTEKKKETGEEKTTTTQHTGAHALMG